MKGLSPIESDKSNGVLWISLPMNICGSFLGGTFEYNSKFFTVYFDSISRFPYNDRIPKKDYSWPQNKADLSRSGLINTARVFIWHLGFLKFALQILSKVTKLTSVWEFS